MTRVAARGFTMIEVLVTIVVIAVGVLAAVGLQAASKKAAFDAIQRSNATALAQEIIERMRANSDQLATYVRTGAQLTVAPNPQACNRDQLCTPTQLVAHDLAAWWQGLEGASERIGAGAGEAAGGLRNPVGCISFPGNGALGTVGAANGCQVQVAIAWRGLSPQATAAEGVEDPNNSPCGTDPALGVFDDPDTDGADFRYRRVIVVRTNLAQSTSCQLPTR